MSLIPFYEKKKLRRVKRRGKKGRKIREKGKRAADTLLNHLDSGILR